MNIDLTATLAEFLYETRYKNLPKSVCESAKRITLDTLSAIISGSSSPGIDVLRNLAVGWGGAEQSSILGFGDRVPAPHAVWVNAAAARARDFDEVHDGAVLHSSITVLPVCLAVAEWQGGVSGKNLIEALVAGMEVIIRMGLSLKESPNVTGKSSTWQLGVFGGCGAAAKLMGLDRKDIQKAMGIAYSMTAGNQQAIIEGTLMVRTMQGFTAQVGLMSTILAQAGIDGPMNALDGKFGYFPVFHQNEYEREIITQGLGNTFEMERVSLKPYPCCKVIHSSISGLQDLIEGNKLEPNDISAVEIKVNQAAYNLVCHPIESKREPSTVPEAQFSLPYCLGVVLTKHDIFLDDFTSDAICNPEILAASKKIKVVVDSEIEKSAGRRIGPAKIKLFTNSGSVFEIEKDNVKGQPQNPMNMDDVVEKFRKCSRFSTFPLESSDVSKTLGYISDLENLQDAASIVSSLCPIRHAKHT